VESKADTSLFVLHRGTETAYLLLYVDDIVLTASSPALLRHIIQDLQREFAMKDLGLIHHFLGVHVQHLTGGGLHLSQRQFMIDILDRAGMSACKPCSTPVDTNPKLSAATGALLEKPQATDFRSLAGALQYLTFTRPDIAYAVQQVCLHMHAPREPHLQLLSASCATCVGLFTSVSRFDLVHKTTLWSTLMLTGLDARIRVSLPLGMLSFLVTI
jgi:hypothetical protein